MAAGLYPTVMRHTINALTRPLPIPRPFTPSLRDRVEGRTVFITGASGGLGRRLAERVAEAGATVVVTARRGDELDELVDRIRAAGGTAHAIPGDLATGDGVDAVAAAVLDTVGAPDVFVCNAGRSIRRSIADAEDRLHDYERTMAINYLGGVGLTLRLLPAMRRRGGGHVVHSSSIGVPSNLPTFSAYVGSKAALDAFFRIAAIESRSDGVRFTNVHLPLIDTDMAAGSDWDGYSRLSLDEGTDMLVDAIRRRPHQLNNPLGSLTALAYATMPGTFTRLTSRMHRQVHGA
ncbi:SDR family NAD(P)-dependent oxidoreductase [Mycolicibacillus trivialis]|uniref:Oxidoreductase n=1 Tax=Mycolicibacillus trivialis TaxID=1798 RepID=A0A1X2ELB9_9MYCO|nr:SDR family NAD(P)-dependent oxidoreductase [Mycolicibacillus trivialis]ORX05809.1 oxidoreductase [Mycolicibacillus trivialis]